MKVGIEEQSSNKKNINLNNFEEFNELMHNGLMPRFRSCKNETNHKSKLSIGKFSALNTAVIDSTPYTIEINNEILSKSGIQFQYSINICDSGFYDVKQDGRCGYTRAGDIAFIDSRVTSAINSEQPASATVIAVPPALWHAVAPLPPRPHHILQREYTATKLVTAFAREMTMADHNLREGDKDTLVRQMLELVSIGLSESAEKMPGTINQQMQLQRIKAFIRNEIANPELGLGVIAQHFNVSTRYISKLFQSDGQTLMHYLWSTRLQRAEELIRQYHASSLSLKDITFQVGFKNQSHFSKKFFEKYGTSPTQHKNGI